MFKNSVTGNNNGAFDVGELSAGSYYVKITYCPYNESDVTYKLNVSEKHDCVEMDHVKGTDLYRRRPT